MNLYRRMMNKAVTLTFMCILSRFYWHLCFFLVHKCYVTLLLVIKLNLCKYKCDLSVKQPHYDLIKNLMSHSSNFMLCLGLKSSECYRSLILIVCFDYLQEIIKLKIIIKQVSCIKLVCFLCIILVHYFALILFQDQLQRAKSSQRFPVHLVVERWRCTKFLNVESCKWNIFYHGSSLCYLISK